MTNLLFEITTYDVPYDLQTKVEDDIKSFLNLALKNLNVTFSNILSFSTSRRITLYIPEIELEIKPIITIKKGPATNANQEILQKFLSSNNLKLEDCYKDTVGKNQFYFFKQTTSGGPLKDKLPNIIVNEVLNKVTFKRSMFWNTNKVKWARPITNLVLFLDKEAIYFSFAGVESSSALQGHMFLTNGKLVPIRNALDYFSEIKKLHVILPSNMHQEQQLPHLLPISRESIIKLAVNKFAKEHELIPNLPSKLLNELLYLVEYPVVLFGTIPNKYLVLPKELLVNTMVANQRYINFFNKDQTISKHFAVVSNIASKDNGAEIIKGNQKVLNARLEDGLFFYNLDLQDNWHNKKEDLKTITFFENLGNMFDKQERIKKLSNVFFPNINMNNTCDFCKLDLCSKVVAEFPELQGIMGYYYAINSGLTEEEALAIKEQYMPLVSSGELPTTPLGAKLAFLDKLDTLISFFAIGKAPTSSSDPFALRRAALGIIKISLRHNLSFNLSDKIDNNLIEFFIERLIFYLNGLGVKKEIVLAVLSKNSFNIVDTFNKANALNKCLSNNDNLISLFKRVYNIVNSANHTSVEVKSNLLKDKDEKFLFEQLCNLKYKYSNLFDNNITDNVALSTEEYTKYIEDLILLKSHLDSFINNVLIINPETPELTSNRVSLLKLVLEAMNNLGKLENINI